MKSIPDSHGRNCSRDHWTDEPMIEVRVKVTLYESWNQFITLRHSHPPSHGSRTGYSCSTLAVVVRAEGRKWGHSIAVPAMRRLLWVSEALCAWVSRAWACYWESGQSSLVSIFETPFWVKNERERRQDKSAKSELYEEYVNNQSTKGSKQKLPKWNWRRQRSFKCRYEIDRVLYMDDERYLMPPCRGS